MRKQLVTKEEMVRISREKEGQEIENESEEVHSR